MGASSWYARPPRAWSPIQLRRLLRRLRLRLLHHASRLPERWGVAPFLYAIRYPSAWIGAFLVSLDLPVWAQKTQLPERLPASLPAAVPGAPPGGVPATRLMDSYELCKIGRLGQHELYFLTVFVLVGCFIFFLQIDKRLIRHGWEIRKALSESTSISHLSADGSEQPILNDKGEPVTVQMLVPSVSRLIALAGLSMLILFYFAFGIISVYHFGRTCEMPRGIDEVTSFLYAGLTFFAPYLATKFSEIFAPGARRLPLPSVRPEPAPTSAASLPAASPGLESSPADQAHGSSPANPKPKQPQGGPEMDRRT